MVSPIKKDGSFTAHQATNSPGTPPSSPSQNNPVTAEQELTEHASKITEQVLNKDLSIPSMYKGLVTPMEALKVTYTSTTTTGVEIQQQIDPRSAAPGFRPVSGILEHDYPMNLTERGLLPETFFVAEYKSPIPNEFTELINNADSNCKMGLFAEISRAWLIIDCDLYLWDIHDGSDASYFDGLKEPISSVALVKAKKNVFTTAINYLMILTTPTQIAILGFLMDPNEASSVVQLVPDPIFVTTADGILYPVIVGSDHGRIFLGGSDGCVHELNYQPRRGWFRDRCWRVNLSSGIFASIMPKIFGPTAADSIEQLAVDNRRNLLFTRTKSGVVQAFDLGRNGDEFRSIGSMTHDAIVRNAFNVSKKTLDMNCVKRSISIAAIENGELNLVVITDTGTRIYFSCYDPPTIGVRETSRPSTFRVLHVRLPPGYCPSSTQKKPGLGQNAFYANGMFAFSARMNQDQDCLWLISPFLYPTYFYSEVFCVHELPGAVVDIQAFPVTDIDGKLLECPDAITQHLPWKKRIAVLTPGGSVVFRALKPYEILREMFQSKSNALVDLLAGHFDLGSGREQPLANTVLVATHPVLVANPEIYDRALKAFFLFGEYEHRLEAQEGQTPYSKMPTGGSPLPDISMEFHPNLVSTPTREANIQGPRPSLIHQDSNVLNQSLASPPVAGSHSLQQQPNQTQNLQETHRGFGPGPQNQATPATLPQKRVPPGYVSQYQPYQSQYYLQYDNSQWPYSPRHDALYLIVGRILHPFWNRQVVRCLRQPSLAIEEIIIPNIVGDEVTYAIVFLQNVFSFIVKNPSLYISRMSAANLFQADNRNLQIRQQDYEKYSITALKHFLSLTMEILGMWKILCDHQIHIVLQGMDSKLLNMTMRDLVVSGHGIVSAIIHSLISKYLGDNAAIDALTCRLRDVCPTLFRNEDAVGSKVTEILGKVRSNMEHSEKVVWIQEALSLCEQIVVSGNVNVKGFCQQFIDLGEVSGAVRLVVISAKAADPEMLALETMKTRTTTDPECLRAYQIRLDIYRIIFDILSNFMHGSVRKTPLLKTEERQGVEVAQMRTEEIIRAILQCDDEIFHISLYEWMVERKLYDKLLEIKHPFLDSYLQRTAEAVVDGKWAAANTTSVDVHMLDLLWRHHERNQNHQAAAEILIKLSESTTTGLNLQQRLEYLSRGILCGKSCYRRGENLEQWEDKLEVGQIQKHILDIITQRLQVLGVATDDNISAEWKAMQDAVPRLNSQLFHITALYSEFAHPLKLHEAKLEIMYSAGHADPALIEALWSDIIETELSNSLRQSMESQMEIIRRKVVSLGSRYLATKRFFPIEFLVEHLESMKPHDDQYIGWVFSIMDTLGVPFPDLLHLYDKLWKNVASRHAQVTMGADINFAKVLMYMIDLFAKRDVNLTTSYFNRSELVERCKDLIAALIVEFSSRFDEKSRVMSAHLNVVRERLDRSNV